jgi:Flp pilus assembly protein TadG
MSARRWTDDEGTVLLLTLGLSVVLLLLVAVVVDVSAVVLAKRGVASAADGAALAAAQRADRTAVEESAGALDVRLPLDEAAVQDLVATYQDDAAGDQPGLTLQARVDGGEAVVDGYRTITVPFGGWLGVGRVQVHAVARALSPVVP